MEWLKQNKGKAALLAVAALFMIPYFAFQNMKERKAKELSAETFQIDDKLDGVTVTVSRDGTTVAYQDGTKLPADGLGVAAVTLEDNKANPDRLKSAGAKDEDFPVLAFFNASGFDSTGTPVAVRRAKDGKLVWPAAFAPPHRVRLGVPKREGGFTVYYWSGPDQKGKVEVGEADWFKGYMGVEPPDRLPTPEELDKMTDEQLKQLGIQRMTKDEAKLRAEQKSGVRGRVLMVGDPRQPLIPLAVPVHVFKDGTEFQTANGQPPFDPKATGLLTSTKSDAEGRYAVPLPEGRYIVAIEIDGKLHGNALKPGAFPSVRVKDEWVDYDVRKAGQ